MLHAEHICMQARELNVLLDHDNHEHRQAMKDFMKADIYIP